MRVPRPRLTVRRLMILVAVAGLAVGVVVEVRRLKATSEAFRNRALGMRRWESWARREANRTEAGYRAAVESYERSEASGGRYKSSRPRSPKSGRKVAIHFESLRLKYERAARYPWLPVAPDPPAPGPE